MDTQPCPNCQTIRTDTPDGYDTTTIRCAAHLVEMTAKVQAACADESVWTIERHRRNVPDGQLATILDALIIDQRQTMGLKPSKVTTR